MCAKLSLVFLFVFFFRSRGLLALLSMLTIGLFTNNSKALPRVPENKQGDIGEYGNFFR